MKKQKTTITNIEDIEKLLTSVNDADVKVGKFMLEKADMSDTQTMIEIQKFIDKVKPDDIGESGDVELGYLLIINDKTLWGRNGYESVAMWQSKGSPKSNFTTYINQNWKWDGSEFKEAKKLFNGDAKAYTKFLAIHGLIKTCAAVYNTSTRSIELKVC